MRIAFDAKRAFLNDTGLGNYSRILLNSLFRLYPENQYYLATPKVTGMYRPVKTENVNVIVPSGLGSLLKPVWRGGLVMQELKRLKIDLYHGLSHEIPLGARRTGIRTVVTIHDLIFERFPQQYNAPDIRIYRSKIKYACKYADKVIAISRQTMQDLVNIYDVPEEKITVCYQSCDESFMRPVNPDIAARQRAYYKLPEQYFLYVGSVIERKNLLLICKALYQLKGKLDIPLVVIGNSGGNYMKQVREYVAENGLGDSVIFLSDSGRVAFADFPAIYQSSLGLIYPSIYEGFGIPILEGMFSGIPVITSNVSCMPETGGDAAFYIDPYNVDSLADAMLKVAGDSALRASMIEKGRQHAQQFSWETTAAGVMQVYRSLVK